MTHYMRVRRHGTLQLEGTPARTCTTCGTTFTPNSNRQKYCSDCGRRGYGTCEVCGTAFKLMANTTGRWCSVECTMAARTDPTLVQRACLRCGTAFKPRVETNVYCSKACFGEASARPDRECPACGKTYNSRHYSGTCSRECAVYMKRSHPEGGTCERCGAHIPWTATRIRRFCSKECRSAPIGHRKATSGGYMLIRAGSAYPGTDANGYMMEHRYVVEQRIGRSLESWERVHHMNGRRDDNRSENLELWKVKDRSRKDPAGVRQADYHCPGCRCAEL